MDHHHHLDQISPRQIPVTVIMVPFPAQGHLNQLLHFSRLISSYGIPVHYVGSATHNRQAKHRIHGWNPFTIPNIHFHDLPLPPFSTPPPDPNASIKFPAHLQPTFEASLHLREPLAALLRSLSLTTRRLVVVHDPLMAFAAQDVAIIPNGEAYALHSVSAFAIVFYMWESLGKPTNGGTDVIPNDLPHLSFEGCFTDEFADFLRLQYNLRTFDVGDLYNTCRPLEGRFIDLLGQTQFYGNKRQWAVGPLNPVVLGVARGSLGRHKCLEWLDKQPPRSVLYVSFGTMTSISDDQIVELAVGLERSKQRFIWVLRDADRGDVFAGHEEARRTQLPKGYEERVEGTGLIVRDWAPQLEILAHPSSGGFMSHCGWNSCMESLSMGVPVAAWPMHSDQPRNTMLVTHVLKVGLVVREWAQRHELVSWGTIEKAVKKLIDSKEGDEMRKRAEELGIAVRQSASEGRASRAELDSFIAHISR